MLRLSDADLRVDWKKRAIENGSSPAGVLLQNLPPILNTYLHEWHVGVMRSQFLSKIPYGGKVLDVGSGYGRISLSIRAFRPDIRLIGLDFAYPYCQYYAANLSAPALCASIYDLPLKDALFDGIIAITALMYIKTKEEKRIVRGLMVLLKPKGYALFIDPGTEFLKLASPFSTSQSSTSGKGFKKNAYAVLGQTNMSRVIESGGCPIFSAFLPLLYGMARNRAVTEKCLRIIKMLDNRVGRHQAFTLHRWMLSKRIE